MTASKSLPTRPSPESLRKQAEKIAWERSVSLRDAQLVLAREYGVAGWQDLTAEVSLRLGKGLEWAAAQARRISHDNDVARCAEVGGNGGRMTGVPKTTLIVPIVSDLAADRCA
jgi:hypothetical protein